MQLIAGNVATYEGARDLIALGVDGIKVGHRAGLDLHHARGQRRGRAADHRDRGMLARRRAAAGVPLIADGGIKFLRRRHQGDRGRRGLR